VPKPLLATPLVLIMEKTQFPLNPLVFMTNNSFCLFSTVSEEEKYLARSQGAWNEGFQKTKITTLYLLILWYFFWNLSYAGHRPSPLFLLQVYSSRHSWKQPLLLLTACLVDTLPLDTHKQHTIPLPNKTKRRHPPNCRLP
jgi:hypothetical protein